MYSFYTVACLDDNRKYTFSAMSPYDAMKKMVYYLNLNKHEEVVINKTKSGNHLYVEHNNKTYTIRNKMLDK